MSGLVCRWTGICSAFDGQIIYLSYQDLIKAYSFEEYNIVFRLSICVVGAELQEAGDLDG